LLRDAGAELGVEAGLVHLVESGGGEVEVAVVLWRLRVVMWLLMIVLLVVLVLLVVVVLLVIVFLLMIVFMLRGCIVGGVAIVSRHAPQTNTQRLGLAWFDYPYVANRQIIEA